MVNITTRNVTPEEEANWLAFSNAWNDYSEQLIGVQEFTGADKIAQAQKDPNFGNIIGATGAIVNSASAFINPATGLTKTIGAGATSGNVTVTKGKFEEAAKKLGLTAEEIKVLTDAGLINKQKQRELASSAEGKVTDFNPEQQAVMSNSELILQKRGWSSIPTASETGQVQSGLTPVAIQAEQAAAASATPVTTDALGNVIPAVDPNATSTKYGISADPTNQLANSSGTSYDPNAYIGMEKYKGGIAVNPETGVSQSGLAPTFTYGQVQDFFSGKSESEIVRLKKVLTWSGAYDKTDVVSLNGNITQEDLNAVQKGMAIANLNGFTSVEDALSERYKQGLYNGTPYGDANVDLNGDGKADKDTVDALKQLAKNNGLDFSDDYIKNYSEAIKKGETTYDQAASEIRDKFISSAYPMWADDIKAGKDIKDIASPYVQAMSTTLGLDANSIDLNDPAIKNAIAGSSQDGKPVYKSLFDFKRDLRKDARWQNTEEAQKEYADTALSVLKTFGIIG